jgi:hypothetical protein
MFIEIMIQQADRGVNHEEFEFSKLWLDSKHKRCDSCY